MQIRRICEAGSQDISLHTEEFEAASTQIILDYSCKTMTQRSGAEYIMRDEEVYQIMTTQKLLLKNDYCQK